MRGRRTIRDIRTAIGTGRLSTTFTPADVNAALRVAYAGVFLPKHRVGNPGGNTERFVRVSSSPARYRLA